MPKSLSVQSKGSERTLTAKIVKVNSLSRYFQFKNKGPFKQQAFIVLPYIHRLEKIIISEILILVASTQVFPIWYFNSDQNDIHFQKGIVSTNPGRLVMNRICGLKLVYLLT